ncbi:MAG: DNA-binding protein HU [candidate division Zixibacteria bacterium]|jgi:DNA-binding protein HU-beta|nr:DNA-binding protein HU [candidate division Zixibacteria bacterium]
MTKEELIGKIAKDAKVTKVQARRAMDSFFEGVTRSLKKDGRMSFVGFGTFTVTKRKARTGRNPQTGRPIKIAAAKVPKFKAGKKLRAAIK